MSATDSFGRAINPGDTIWVPAKVTGVDNGVITMSYTNEDNSTATITAASGSGGQTTNPDEGDRPPR
jgi:hypothetical protein